MGGSSSKTNCPEDTRTVNINISNGNLNIILDRPRIYLNSGHCSVPSILEALPVSSNTYRISSSSSPGRYIFEILDEDTDEDPDEDPDEDTNEDTDEDTNEDTNEDTDEDPDEDLIEDLLKNLQKAVEVTPAT